MMMICQMRALRFISAHRVNFARIGRHYSNAQRSPLKNRAREPIGRQLDLDAQRSLLLEQLRTRQQNWTQTSKSADDKQKINGFPWEMQVAWLPVIRGYLKRVLDDYRLNRLPDAIATSAASELAKDSLEEFLIKNAAAGSAAAEGYDWSRGFRPPAEPPAFHLRRYQKWTELTTGRDHVDLIYACRLMLFLTPFYMRNTMKVPPDFAGSSHLADDDATGDLPFKRHQSTECLLQDLVHSFLFTNQRLLDIKGIQFFQNFYLNQLRLPVEPWLFHPLLTVYARQGNLKE